MCLGMYLFMYFFVYAQAFVYVFSASTDLGEIAMIAPRWQPRSCTDHTMISAEAAQRGLMMHK